jgi:transposase
MTQIRGFLLTYGIESPGRAPGPWRPTFLEWLRHAPLPDALLQAVFDSLRRVFFEADLHVREHTLLLRRLASTPRHAVTIALLTTVPGIGWLTALAISVEVFDWSRFLTGEALSAYLGLTPAQYSSGEVIRHGGITHTGNRRLRSLLVESCWSAIRADGGLRKSYEAIRRRRGAKRAIVAIARKMCHRLVAMVRTGECYRVEAA